MESIFFTFSNYLLCHGKCPKLDKARRYYACDLKRYLLLMIGFYERYFEMGIDLNVNS